MMMLPSSSKSKDMNHESDSPSSSRLQNSHRRRYQGRYSSSPPTHMSTMSVFVIMTMMMTVLTKTYAKVSLPEYNKSFTSMPAMFGNVLSLIDPPVLAHLILMKDRPLMCVNDNNTNSNGFAGNREANSTTTPAAATAGGDGGADPTEQQDTIHTSDSMTTIPAPRDGLPVALLIERGECTFWEKSEEASKLGEAVKYVIIYDNEMSPDLVPMSSEFPSNMTLFFVSMMSGHGAYKYCVCVDASFPTFTFVLCMLTRSSTLSNNNNHRTP
jgi:hypothetical protein